MTTLIFIIHFPSVQGTAQKVRGPGGYVVPGCPHPHEGPLPHTLHCTCTSHRYVRAVVLKNILDFFLFLFCVFFMYVHALLRSSTDDWILWILQSLSHLHSGSPLSTGTYSDNAMDITVYGCTYDIILYVCMSEHYYIKFIYFPFPTNICKGQEKVKSPQLWGICKKGTDRETKRCLNIFLRFWKKNHVSPPPNTVISAVNWLPTTIRVAE